MLSSFFIRVLTPENGQALFFQDADYISAINTWAVAAHLAACQTHDFLLTDRGMQAIASGSSAGIHQAVERWCRCCGMTLRNKYQRPRALQGCSHEIRPLFSLHERVREALDIYRSPLVADRVAYPWGSAQCYFAAREPENDRRIEADWLRQKMLGTRSHLPESWSFRADGMLSLRVFVDTSEAERYLGTAERFHGLVNFR